jgi:hypothetical protein
LDIPGYTWIYLGIFGETWIYLGIPGYNWGYLDILGDISGDLDILGEIWIYMRRQRDRDLYGRQGIGDIWRIIMELWKT